MKMKKIIYLILSFVILIGCISCKENNIDLEDIYYNKLPMYEKQIVENISLFNVEMGGNYAIKYEFILLDKNNSECLNSDIYYKTKDMLGDNFQKAIVFADKTNNWEYVIAEQYKNSFVAYRMENRQLDGGIAQYRHKNVLMSYFCYSYFMLDNYKEIEGVVVDKKGILLLGGNHVSELMCPKDIDSVIACAFLNNEVIESIIMNDELDTIFWYAFYGASNL